MTLKEYMSKKKISISAMARAMGVARSTLYNYIDRSTTPSLAHALIMYQVCSGRVSLKEMLSVVEAKTGVNDDSGLDDL